MRRRRRPRRRADRQLRQLHLQPRPVPRGAGRRGRGAPPRRDRRRRRRARCGPTHLVISPGPEDPRPGRHLGRRHPRARRRRCRSSASASATRPSARRSAPGWCAAASRCTARPAPSSTTAARSSPACENPMVATRYHSLVVDPDLAPDLELTAWCDGDVVMGVRHRSLPVEGVQFHPESILTGLGQGTAVELPRAVGLSRPATPPPDALRGDLPTPSTGCSPARTSAATAPPRRWRRSCPARRATPRRPAS